MQRQPTLCGKTAKDGPPDAKDGVPDVQTRSILGGAQSEDDLMLVIKQGKYELEK